MVCAGCGCESFGAVFTQDGPRHKCNACGNLFVPELAPEQPAPPIVEPAPVVEVRNATRKPSPEPVGVPNLLTSARARIRELTSEIKRLESLKRERDELRRLLAAAKTKPKASPVIRALRSHTGS